MNKKELETIWYDDNVIEKKTNKPGAFGPNTNQEKGLKKPCRAFWIQEEEILQTTVSWNMNKKNYWNTLKKDLCEKLIFQHFQSN